MHPKDGSIEAQGLKMLRRIHGERHSDKKEKRI